MKDQESYFKLSIKYISHIKRTQGSIVIKKLSCKIREAYTAVRFCTDLLKFQVKGL